VGRLTGWNAAPARLRFDLPNLLHMYCHPLRAPDRFLALYRQLLRGAAPDIPGRSTPAPGAQVDASGGSNRPGLEDSDPR